MSSNFLIFAAISIILAFIGLLAFGERPPSMNPDISGVEAATANVTATVPEQASPSLETVVSGAEKASPDVTAALAAADETSSAPNASAAGEGEIPRVRRLEQAMNRLTQRIELLEQALVLQQQQLASGSFVTQEVEEESEEEQPADTPERRQEALIASGVEPDWAADIVWRQSQRALERLEIQDLARREGWFGSDRYFEELSNLETSADSLHEEIGDAAYDRYLYSMGKSNRVKVDSVIQGSPAEQAGLTPGDVIISYADERLFGWSELRQATASGERGETVIVRVMRGQDTVDLLIPRGPLGVRLDTTIMEPLE